ERYQLADFSAYADPRTAPVCGTALATADAAIGSGMPWSADLSARAKRLKVVSSVSVGVDNYDVAALSARGIALGHTAGVLDDTTADTAMALILASARRVVELADWVRDGHWTRPVGPAQYGVNVH